MEYVKRSFLQLSTRSNGWKMSGEPNEKGINKQLGGHHCQKNQKDIPTQKNLPHQRDYCEVT